MVISPGKQLLHTGKIPVGLLLLDRIRSAASGQKGEKREKEGAGEREGAHGYISQLFVVGSVCRRTIFSGKSVIMASTAKRRARSKWRAVFTP